MQTLKVKPVFEHVMRETVRMQKIAVGEVGVAPGMTGGDVSSVVSGTPDGTGGGAIAMFLQNLKQLRQVMNPQIKFINKLVPYQKQLQQIAQGLVKVNPSRRKAIESRFVQINQMVQPLVAGEQQDSAQMVKIEQYLMQALQQSFPEVQQAASGQADPNATQPNVQGQPAVDPIVNPAAPQQKGKGTGSGFGQSIGRGLGNMVSAPGNALRGLQQGWQQGRKPAASEHPILTARMGSASQFLK